MTTLSVQDSRLSRTRQSMNAISVAFCGDSDDLFTFYAWEQGYVGLCGWRASFRRHDVGFMDHAAAAEIFDVVNISSAVYPSIADRYWIMATGGSVGRGDGPVIVSKHQESLRDLEGRRIAVSDVATTGGILAMMYCPGAEFVPCPFHRIADGILCGEFDAGVMNHEELLYFYDNGLQLVCNLGELWLDETGLPLPVGLNVVRKAHGRAFAGNVQHTCRESLEWAMAHSEEVTPCVTRFGHGGAARFGAGWNTDDVLDFPDDVRQGLSLLFDRVADLDLGPRLHGWDVIDS